jgi:hypothetical protein
MLGRGGMKSRGGLGILVLLGMALNAGCGISTSATFLRAPPRAMAPRSPDSVEVFGAGPPSRPHVDLALIEAEQQSTNTPGDTPELIAKLRQKAGELGCDGLVLASIFSRVDTMTTIVTGNTHDQKGISGTCIVYTEAAVAQGAPLGP